MDLIESRSIFSPATGFIRRGGFEWTCNPYVGCTFGCSYCYAMFLPQNRRPIEDWGKWFTAKKNAAELARKQAQPEQDVSDVARARIERRARLHHRGDAT